MVVSNIFYFHPYLGKIPILTNIFQMGWNHQGGFFASCMIHQLTISLLIQWIPSSDDDRVVLSKTTNEATLKRFLAAINGEMVQSQARLNDNKNASESIFYWILYDFIGYRPFHEFHYKNFQARLPWLCDTTSSAGQPEPESTENDASGAGDLGWKVERLWKLFTHCESS